MVDSKVNIQVNIKGSQPQIQRLKKQEEDDHWISEEELYTEGSSDEEKPSHSSRKHLKGMDQEEILKKERDLSEMKKSIKVLEGTLADGKAIDEIYDVGKFRGKRQPFDVEVEREKIAARIAEIKDLDEVLNLKAEEMKTAKLERMRETEESTELLKQLSKSETSEAVRNNSEQFLRLLQDEVSDHRGSSRVKVARSEKTKAEEAPRKPRTFIERNIQLAKCGNGVLSLTDEEKLRLKLVLKDIEEPANDQILPAENQYVLNDENKKALEEIDRKLEEHEKTKFSLNSTGGSVLRENGKDDGQEKIKPKVQRMVDKELKRLKEVDKLLNSLNSTTNEIISPLVDEDLQYLIEKSRQLFNTTTEKDKTDNLKLPTKEKIVELVSAAKTGMPNFRFRYE